MASAERVDVLIDTPEEIRLRARVASPALLVVAETHFRGWEACVDGASVPILHANASPGVHGAELRDRPRSFAVGVALTAVGLGLTLGLWLIDGRRPPRS